MTQHNPDFDAGVGLVETLAKTAVAAVTPPDLTIGSLSSREIAQQVLAGQHAVRLAVDEHQRGVGALQQR